MSADAVKYWEDYVAKSKGTAVFIPKELEAKGLAIEKKRKEFNRLLSEVVAKTELELNIATQNLFMEIRQALADKGQPDIWGKDVQWNHDALKDEQLVIHIVDAK